jgi:hypothetical protein
MDARRHPIRRQVAIVTIWSLLLSPVGFLRGLEAPIVSAAGQATTPAKPVSATPPAVDGGWPRSYATPSGARLIMYQPQVSSWENQKRMTLYAAVSYTAKGTDKPVLGTVKADADTRVSLAERLVDFSVFKITDSNFPTLRKEQMQEIVGEITRGIPQEERVLALDRVLAGLDKSQILPTNVEGVKAQVSGGRRQHRRRGGMESDRRERSEVRDQHELGSLRARAHEDLLSARQRVLVEGDDARRAVDACGHAA